MTIQFLSAKVKYHMFSSLNIDWKPLIKFDNISNDHMREVYPLTIPICCQNKRSAAWVCCSDHFPSSESRARMIKYSSTRYNSRSVVWVRRWRGRWQIQRNARKRASLRSELDLSGMLILSNVEKNSSKRFGINRSTTVFPFTQISFMWFINKSRQNRDTFLAGDVPLMHNILSELWEILQLAPQRLDRAPKREIYNLRDEPTDGLVFKALQTVDQKENVVLILFLCHFHACFTVLSVEGHFSKNS